MWLSIASPRCFFLSFVARSSRCASMRTKTKMELSLLLYKMNQLLSPKLSSAFLLILSRDGFLDISSYILPPSLLLKTWPVAISRFQFSSSSSSSLAALLWPVQPHSKLTSELQKFTRTTAIDNYFRALRWPARTVAAISIILLLCTIHDQIPYINSVSQYRRESFNLLPSNSTIKADTSELASVRKKSVVGVGWAL